MPKSKTAPNLSLADMCALAWVRSNFPKVGGPDILEATRKGAKVTVLLAEQQEMVSFEFGSELAAARAFKQLPPATGLKCPFQIAAEDLVDLEAAMNFGHAAPPEAENSYEFAPG